VDNFQKLKNQIVIRSLLSFVVAGILVMTSWWITRELVHWPLWLSILISTIVLVAMGVCFSLVFTYHALEPVRVIWQAILHVTPGHQGTPPPNLEQTKLGRELVTSLSLQVYQLASNESATAALNEHRSEVSQAVSVVDHLPLPMFICNRDQLVINASSAGLDYCGVKSSDLFGKPLFDSVKLEFPSEVTLESWMKNAHENRVTDSAYWERVRVRLVSDETKLHQCDMAAYYNRDDPSGAEFIITLFDRTERYNQDDKAMNFVALAVHELRTPLTVLRGYVEVFEEELGATLGPELKDFMYKLQASTEQLTAFVNNILNVARIEENQLVLQLHEENWPEVLQKAAADNELRASVRGKHISYHIDPNLPTVAVDRVSIYEVISNLLDNAIKYSADSKEIIVSASMGRDGTVVTTIQDFGVGIPESVMPNLFEKFYRNHRTRSEIGGTGLGLYLSKAIVNAHGGQIWAESKEGQGSTFGFSLIPFDQLADEQKKSNNTEITRTAHGWIKNHSLYRR
jgi:signal transduction histidine kinase